MLTISKRTITVALSAVLSLQMMGGAHSGSKTLGAGLARAAEAEGTTPDGPSEKRLRMTIFLVASMDGGKLQAGKKGWMMFLLGNPSDSHLRISTACLNAKGAEERPKPSKWEGEGTAGMDYRGFGIATLQYAFVRLDDESPPTWELLAPPDDPVRLKPRDGEWYWRIVRAPKEPGVYRLRVRFNNSPAVEASKTFNNYFPTEPVSVEGSADGVEIVASGG